MSVCTERDTWHKSREEGLQSPDGTDNRTEKIRGEIGQQQRRRTPQQAAALGEAVSSTAEITYGIISRNFYKNTLGKRHIATKRSSVGFACSGRVRT